MKNFLQIIVNLFLFITYSITNLIQIMWYGKLPKISIYHQTKYHNFELIDIYEKENIQSELGVSNKARETIINEFINEFFSDNKRTNIVAELKVPIFNGTEIIGNSNLKSLLNETKDIYLNKNKL